MGTLVVVVLVCVGVVAVPFLWADRLSARRRVVWPRTMGETPDLHPDDLDQLREIGAGLIGELPDDPTPAHVLLWASRHRIPMVYASHHGHTTTIRFESGHRVDLIGLSEWSIGVVQRAAEQRWILADVWSTSRDVDLLIGNRRLRHLTRIGANSARVPT